MRLSRVFKFCFFIAMVFFLFLCVSACEQHDDNELKQELSIAIKNESNRTLSRSKIVAFAANETPSDSLIITVDPASEQVYKWKPKLNSSTGTIYFYLTDSISQQILYYSAYKVLANQTNYKIIISNDSSISIE